MRRVGILLLDGALMSGPGVLMDMLALSNRFIRRQYADREERGTTVDIRLLSPTGAPCRTAAGHRIAVDGAMADPQHYDAVYVAAFDAVDPSKPAEAHGAIRDWLRDRHADGVILAASGGAILLFAEAGLLNRARVAAPWWLESALKRGHPHLETESGAKFSEQDKILCGAGMNGDFGLAIRLVERVLSSNVANWVATLAMIGREDRTPAGGIGIPAPPPTDDPIIGRAQIWLQERFSEKPSMAELAEFLAISERTLTRRFEKALGTTPLAYLQGLRIEVAKGMLARSNQTIERIAYLVSYSDPKFFKQVFRGLTGLSPSAYRRQAQAANAKQ